MLEYNFFDRVHAWTFNVPKMFRKVPSSEVMKYRNNIKNAAHFVVHDDIIDAVVQLSKDLTLVEKYFKMAKLPFEKTWIEFDQLERMRSIKRHSDVMFELNETAISKPCGLLFERLSTSSWQVTEFVELDDSTICPRPIVITIDSEADKETSLDNNPRGISKKYKGLAFGVEYMALGISDKSNPKNHVIIPDWAAHKISSHTNAFWDSHFNAIDDEKVTYIIMFELTENRGFLRFLITLLAIMYKAPTETIAHAPLPGTKTVGMNKVKYLPYSTISLSLPKRSRISKITKILESAYRSEFQIPVRSYQRRYTDRSTGVTRMVDVRDYVKFADMPKRHEQKSYEVK